ncbi:CBS domain-containing protein [Actinomadura kijaniata]|uniref:CBS domain-containing protein n=1 Tax=Actinomadura namibiensis TaxID=182080 RepID=A0A7W3LNM0_ACTNM|nr:CBS domain-containing protein [Actinomadura namibiensis]MBA8951412.1 CBS domain-containing protein [Actinomadura namibiensis]
MAGKVRDIMTGSPVTVSPQDDIITVAKKMRDEDIGAVLVTDGGDLRGLVTDRDLVVRGLVQGGDLTKVDVGGVCSEATASVSPDDSLESAAKLMREHAVRRLPVVEDGRPVGIVSLGDLAIEKDEQSAVADISAAKPNV